MIRFTWLYVLAWARGLFYRWPQGPPLPRRWEKVYSSAGCSLVGIRDCYGLYLAGHWIPWSFQSCRGAHGCRGFSSRFVIPLSEEEQCRTSSSRLTAPP